MFLQSYLKANALENAFAYVRSIDNVRVRLGARQCLCTEDDGGRQSLPMYDVQHARRSQAAAGRLLMYDVDLDYSARCAGMRKPQVVLIFDAC